MTSPETDNGTERPPSVPKGAYGTFLFVCGVGFVLMITGLVGYGVYGNRITTGLDLACAEASLDAGRKFEAAGKSTQAIQKYRQALGGNITDDGLRYRCGRSIGDLLFRDRRYREAVAAYRELPEAAFDNAGAYTGYVTALWRSEEGAEAIRLGKAWLAEAVAERNNEQESWARNILMRASDAEGDADSSLEHARRILAVDPSSDAGLYMAQVLRREGDVAGARVQVESYLKVCDNPALQKDARDLLKRLSAESASAGES